MYKSKATAVAVILFALAVFIVATVATVFDDDSKERYQNVASPADAAQQDDAMTAVDVEAETTEPVAQNDVGGINETVTEHMEDVAESVPETVIDEVAEVTSVADTLEQMPTSAQEAEEMLTEAVTAESVAAQVHIVTAEGLKYNPLVTVINVGDTVAWENMSSHDTQAIEGLVPEGAELWHSALSENYQRTFTQEGIYIYKCTPHFGSGMGGAIIVGKPVNLDAIIATNSKGAAGRLVKKAIATANTL